MALSVEEIKKIATLARLKLTAEEEKRYAETISAVLDYMTILNEVDTSRVEPTSQVTGLEDVFREDEVSIASNREKILAQMPETESGELVVPEVFESVAEES